MKTDEKKVNRRYCKCLKLISMGVSKGDTVLFQFIDKLGNKYVHYQVNPQIAASQSKAKTYLFHIVTVHNMQSPNKITYTGLLPDALNNMEISDNPTGSYFLVDCCEKEMKDGSVWYCADYISDSLPSKEAIEQIKKYETSPEYQSMILKADNTLNPLIDANRRYTERVILNNFAK